MVKTLDCTDVRVHLPHEWMSESDEGALLFYYCTGIVDSDVPTSACYDGEPHKRHNYISGEDVLYCPGVPNDEVHPTPMDILTTPTTGEVPTVNPSDLPIQDMTVEERYSFSVTANAWICSLCGALVDLTTDTHDQWHERLDRMMAD